MKCETEVLSFDITEIVILNLYEPLLDRAGLSCDSPLFCQLSKTKYGYKPRSKGLSCSRFRSRFSAGRR